MDRADLEAVSAAFAQAARWAAAAGFDVVQLHMGHGYLLAGFLSPLTNRRADEYGGALENRLRFPLAVFDAVRAVWPEERPLAVALSATDWAKGGFDVPDAVIVARTLREHGCDLITVLAGQTVPDDEPRYDFEALAGYSDIIRNEAGIATLATTWMTTSGPANTLLAGGRADLCLMQSPR
jgi:anthraniloyl-CoA monooxygenase